MFKNVLSYAVAASILLTSFEGVAVRGKLTENQQKSATRVASRQSSSVNQKYKLSDENAQIYRDLTTSGPAFLNRERVGNLYVAIVLAWQQAEKKRFALMNEDLKALEEGTRNTYSVPYLQHGVLFKYGEANTVEMLKEGLIDAIQYYKKSEWLVNRGENLLIKEADHNLASPHYLIEYFQKLFSSLCDQIVTQNDRIFSCRGLLQESSGDSGEVIYEFENLKDDITCFRKVLQEYDPTLSCYARSVKRDFFLFKSFEPFLILFESIFEGEEKKAMTTLIDRALTLNSVQTRCRVTLGVMQRACDFFDELTSYDLRKGGQRSSHDFRMIYIQNLGQLIDKCNLEIKASDENLGQFYAEQRRVIEEAVQVWLQDAAQKKARVEEERKLQDELNRLRKAEAAEKAHQKKVEVIKAVIVARESELLRVQKQAEEMTQQAALHRASAPKLSHLDMTPSGRLIHWGVTTGGKSFNQRKKEQQEQIAKQLATEDRKADAKAGKSHEIDPARSQSTSGSSSSSSASSSSSSSSASGSSILSAGTPGTQYRAILGSNHYKTLKSLLTDKESGMRMKSVKGLFDALGGYMDLSTHSGSRVGMGLRHIDTGKAALFEVDYDGDEEEDNNNNQSVESNSSGFSSTASTNSSSSSTASTSSCSSSSSSSPSTSSTAPDVRMVMHGTHARSKNGRKGLRPEQILDIREMLITAGYTLETVISKPDVSTGVANIE